MEEWKEIQKKYLILEVTIGIIGILICCIIGIYLDWSVLVKKNDFGFANVKDYYTLA